MPRSPAPAPVVPSPSSGPVGTRSIDLNVQGINQQAVFDVSAVDRVTLEGRLEQGTWATAEVTLEGGVRGGTFVGLDDPVVITGEGFTYDVDVTNINKLALDVTTGEGGTGVARFYLNGWKHIAVGSGFRGSVVPVAPASHGALILVTGTGTGSSVTAFTATAATGGGEWDRVTIKANNIHSAAVVLTLEIIDTGTLLTQSIAFDSGQETVLDGKELRNGATVLAFAATANVIELDVSSVRVLGGYE